MVSLSYNYYDLRLFLRQVMSFLEMPPLHYLEWTKGIEWITGLSYLRVRTMHSNTLYSSTLFGNWINTSYDSIQQHVDLLTELDRAIGDGDHGDNMLRGFKKLHSRIEEFSLLTTSAAFQMAGTTLIMSIGGAAGPLFGSLFLGMGKACQQQAFPQAKDVTESELGFDFFEAYSQGVAAVMARGKSKAGQKTMLDVLIPVNDFLILEKSNSSNKESTIQQSQWLNHEFLKCLEEKAETSLMSTKDMQAMKGRASFLKERSIGHIDPGAMTSLLLIQALTHTLAGAVYDPVDNKGNHHA